MWRRALFLVVALCLCNSAFAQLRIAGPEVALVGQSVRLSAAGLNPPNLSEPDGLRKLQEWNSKITLMVDGPMNAEVDVDADLALQLGRAEVKYRIEFTPLVNGVYFVVLDDNASGAIAVKRITVGGTVPNPPQPLPVPVTEGRRLVLLVREGGEVTPTMNLTELSLRDGPQAKYLSDKKHQLLILSDDRGIPENASTAMKEAFAKAKGMSLPALAVINPSVADSSGVLGVESIDKNASPDDVIAVVKKYGG